MLVEKLNQIKNKFTVVIDSSGGNELLKDLETLVEDIYMNNPYIDLISVDLVELKNIETVSKRVETYFRNKHKKVVEGNQIVGDYLKYKIEQQGLYCVYDKTNCKLKIKM